MTDVSTGADHLLHLVPHGLQCPPVGVVESLVVERPPEYLLVPPVVVSTDGLLSDHDPVHQVVDAVHQEVVLGYGEVVVDVEDPVSQAARHVDRLSWALHELPGPGPVELPAIFIRPFKIDKTNLSLSRGYIPLTVCQ